MPASTPTSSEWRSPAAILRSVRAVQFYCERKLHGRGGELVVSTLVESFAYWSTAGTDERQVYGIPSCSSPRQRVDLRQRQCALESFGHLRIC